MKNTISNKSKPKTSYTVWQNTVYVVRNALTRDSIVIYIMMAQIMLAPAIAVVTMFFPKVLASQILSKVDISSLISTLLFFTIVTVVLQTLKTYIDNTCQARRIGMRIGLCHDILNKAITTDYANLEITAFTDAKQKAHNITNNNNNTAEQIYYTYVSLGSNLLGFIVYIILLVKTNSLILIMTVIFAVLAFYVRRWANKWQHDHDTENASYTKGIRYISTIGDNMSLAKDLRIFGMLNWLNDVYGSYMKLSYDWQKKVKRKHLIADLTDCVVTFLREGILYAFLINLILNKTLTIDSFILLFVAIGGFSGWVTGILNEYAVLQQRSLDYCRLREYLEFPDNFKREDGEIYILTSTLSIV